MRKLFIAALACVFFSASAAESQNQALDSAQSVPTNEMATLLQDQAASRRAVALRLAPVKSARELQTHLRNNPDSPLFALSAGARQRFLKSLTFNANGLTGFQYTDLEAELTASQIYRVLSLFGAQDTTPLLRNSRIADDLDGEIMGKSGNGVIVPLGDHREYACVGRATCELSPTRICMSSCVF